MVEDLVHDESKINKDQNDVDLSLNDSNQHFACNRHLEPCLNMVFDKLEDAKHVIMHMQGERGLAYE